MHGRKRAANLYCTSAPRASALSPHLPRSCLHQSKPVPASARDQPCGRKIRCSVIPLIGNSVLCLSILSLFRKPYRTPKPATRWWQHAGGDRVECSKVDSLTSSRLTEFFHTITTRNSHGAAAGSTRLPEPCWHLSASPERGARRTAGGPAAAPANQQG